MREEQIDEVLRKYTERFFLSDQEAEYMRALLVGMFQDEEN